MQARFPVIAAVLAGALLPHARPAYAQAPAGPEFRVNSNTGTRNYYPSVASHRAGDFVVVWSAYANGTVAAFARLFDAQGVPRGGELQVGKSLP